MSRLFSALLLILPVSLLAPAGLAQAPSQGWYISGLASYVDDDEIRNVDDGLSGGQLALGIPFRGPWSLEVFGLFNEFNADGFDADQEQNAFGVGVVRWFNLNGVFSPYVGIAGGFSDTSRVSGLDESAAMTSGALGLLVGFGDSAFGWRSEARYRRILEDIALSDIYLSTGLHWSFGRADGTRRGRRGRRNDSDADGVTDNFDLCPGTTDMVVDARGCPEADNDRDGVVNRLDRCPRTPNNIRVNSRGCPPDSDRDGVIDALDACRGTAWEAVVDERGCPINEQKTPPADADGDGVADANDSCPGTRAGTKVDQRGCALAPEAGRTIVLRGVAFASNSSQLSSASYKVLNENAAMLLANPTVRAEVVGHTDSQGDDAYNQWLSLRRAEAVRNYLVSRGVASSNLSARGAGETSPVADNATAAGRALNRRVELKILSR